MMAMMNRNNEICFAVLNPKSLSLGQIFGEFGASSHEWHDGILPIIFRKFAQSSTPKRKWLIFDGSIDNSWAENLNSVLDDNRKLCLSSGDIIYMQNSMNFIFETSELDSASPSTVLSCPSLHIHMNFVVTTFFFADLSVRNCFHGIAFAGLDTVSSCMAMSITVNHPRCEQT